jgi:hypothetical protein
MTADPLIVHACHCRQCQRVTGSAFVMNALVEKEKVEVLSGETAHCLFPGTSHTAYFCPHCATYVWSQYTGGGWLSPCWFVRVGALDEPDRCPPDVHIFTASKQPWVVLPEGAPAYEEFYSFDDVWPQASLERMAPHWA